MNLNSSWVTLREAAAQLGVTERTLRRRIKAGEAPAQLAPGPRGPQYLVPITTERLPLDGATSTILPVGAAALAQDMTAVRGEVAALRDEVAWLRQQVKDLAALLSER